MSIENLLDELKRNYGTSAHPRTEKRIIREFNVAQQDRISFANLTVELRHQNSELQERLRTAEESLHCAKEEIQANAWLHSENLKLRQKIEESQKQNAIYQIYSLERGWVDIDKQSYDNNTWAGHETRIVYASPVVPAQQEWQPIEGCPFAQEVILWCSKYEQNVFGFKNASGSFIGRESNDLGRVHALTHWTPMLSQPHSENKP